MLSSGILSFLTILFLTHVFAKVIIHIRSKPLRPALLLKTLFASIGLTLILAGSLYQFKVSSAVIKFEFVPVYGSFLVSFHSSFYELANGSSCSQELRVLSCLLLGSFLIERKSRQEKLYELFSRYSLMGYYLVSRPRVSCLQLLKANFLFKRQNMCRSF